MKLLKRKFICNRSIINIVIAHETVEMSPVINIQVPVVELGTGRMSHCRHELQVALAHRVGLGYQAFLGFLLVRRRPKVYNEFYFRYFAHRFSRANFKSWKVSNSCSVNKVNVLFKENSERSILHNFSCLVQRMKYKTFLG